MKNLSDTFRILGAKPRLKIVSLLLKSSPLCVNAITEQLNISQSAVSQHLRVLKMAGWVKAEKKGYWMHYSLNRNKLDQLLRSLEKLAATRGQKPCRSEKKGRCVKRKGG